MFRTLRVELVGYPFSHHPVNNVKTLKVPNTYFSLGLILSLAITSFLTEMAIIQHVKIKQN